MVQTVEQRQQYYEQKGVKYRGKVSSKPLTTSQQLEERKKNYEKSGGKYVGTTEKETVRYYLSADKQNYIEKQIPRGSDPNAPENMPDIPIFATSTTTPTKQTVKYYLTDDKKNYIEKTIPYGAKPEDYAPSIPVVVTATEKQKPKPQKVEFGKGQFSIIRGTGGKWYMSSAADQRKPQQYETKYKQLPYEMTGGLNIFTPETVPTNAERVQVGTMALMQPYASKKLSKQITKYQKQGLDTEKREVFISNEPQQIQEPKYASGSFFNVLQRAAEKYIPSKSDLNKKRESVYNEYMKTGKISFLDEGRTGFRKETLSYYKTQGTSYTDYISQNREMGFTDVPSQRFRASVREPFILFSVGAAFGGAGVVASSISKTAASVWKVGTAVLGGAYAYSKGKELFPMLTGKSKLTPYEQGEWAGDIAYDVTFFGGGAKAGSKFALGLGFLPKQSPLPRLKENRIEVVTKGNEEFPNVRSRTVSLEYGTKGKGVDLLYFSRTNKGVKMGFGNRIGFGTPSGVFDNIQTEFPTGQLSTRSLGEAATSRAAFKSKNWMTGEKETLQNIMKLESMQHYSKTNVYQREYTKVESFRTRRGFKYYLDELMLDQTFGFQPARNYGFVVYRTQIKGRTRPSGDVDTLTFGSERKTSEFAKTQANTLNKVFKDPAFWKEDQPFLVQTKFGGKSHKGDIHPYGVEMPGQEAAESFYGIPYDYKTVYVGNRAGFGLTFGGTSKASSIGTIRWNNGGLFIAPEPHRAKDVGDYFVIKKEMVSVTGKGKELLKSIRGQYPKTLGGTGQDPKSPSPNIKPDDFSLLPVTSGMKKPSYFLSPSRSYLPSLSYSVRPSRSVSSSYSLSQSPSISVSPSPSISRSPSMSTSYSVSYSISPSPSPSPSPNPNPFPIISSNLWNSYYFPIKRSVTKKVTQKKKYTPTFYSAVFNIVGKKQKGAEKTGLLNRPITKDFLKPMKNVFKIKGLRIV